jgi:hypothetical protein
VRLHATRSRSDDVSIRTVPTDGPNQQMARTNRCPEPTDGPTLIDSRGADSRGGGSRAVPASVIHHKPSHAQPRLAIVLFAWIVGRRKPHST